MDFKDLNERFKYKADPKYWDNFQFMSKTDEIIYGDCEDYSLYVAREVSGGTILGFWKDYIKGKYEFWHVKTRRTGDGHCVLIMDKQGTDNWTKKWVSESEIRELHDFKYKIPLVIVAGGIVMGLMYKMWSKI